MDAERFRKLLNAPGPIASVYFDNSHDTHDAETQLDLKWRAVKEELERQGVGQAVVDHSGADLTTHLGGALHSETLDGGGFPVHHAAGAESAAYGDPQLRSDEAARKNMRAVADRVSALVDDKGIELIFVVGAVRSRSDFLAALPERLHDQTVALDVGARHSGHGFDEIERAIEAKFVKRQLRAIDDAAQRFTAEVGRDSGLAVEGLDAVCSALRQGAVETLILGDIGDATVVADEGLTTVTPNENVLSEQGAAPDKTLRADEALPMFAISIGASLVRTGERIVPADGVGALLRYAPTLHQPVG